MKTIFLKSKSKRNNDFKIGETKTDYDEKISKTREKIEQMKQKSDISLNIINVLDDYNEQIKMINKLYLGEDFKEKKFILSELNTKLNSYKQQDIKKNLHEIDKLITIDNIIEKLVSCKLKCFYCNCKLLIIFEKVRESNQWTLDRLNNYDEHSHDNTIISCLKCNLQRRRKNSDKFLFTKQLETNQIKIKKID
jgi:hypothetical protein